MPIYIVFPKEYFSLSQLGRLGRCRVYFWKGKRINLEDRKELFRTDPYILAVDPTYLKDGWDAFPVERIRRMKGLKALCLTTTSYSWVDGKELAARGILLTNTPGKSTEAVAEFNLYMMHALLRHLPLIAKHGWTMDYDHFLGMEAKGITAGIVGFGRIGKRVAELCKGQGMRVLYWNRSKKRTPFQAISLATLFSTSDVVFITIATPPELRGFIDKPLLARMKKTAMVVCTSDTCVLDAPFVIKQVAREKLGGFAFESATKTMQDYKGNVMVFPEQAYFTKGTLENTARILTDTLVSLENGRPINAVN